ncbi:MAG: type I-B CRISPR-associated endonuclease Cas1b [Candidatus Parvarchaeum sp.]
MESKPIYIFKSGKLKRKGNTLYFISYGEDKKEVKRALPIVGISDIYIYGRVWMSPGVTDIISKLSIPIHLFSYYGFYRATLMPKKTLLSGSTIISQAKTYLDSEKRLEIAREFIRGASDNMLKTISTQLNQETYDDKTQQIRLLQDKIDGTNTINELMAIEGNIRNCYYGLLDIILPNEFKIVNRVKRPPNNPINAMISFGNSLLYAVTLSEIYNTHLEPTISFLHEPFERRYSLSLDISEIFKPFIVDRVILKLVNKNMIDLSYFDEKLNYATFNEKGKKLFIEEFDKKLSDTIKHKTLNRNVSYRHLIRLECYKLEKEILGIEKYKAFRFWW